MSLKTTKPGHLFKKLHVQEIQTLCLSSEVSVYCEFLNASIWLIDIMEDLLQSIFGGKQFTKIYFRVKMLLFHLNRNSDFDCFIPRLCLQALYLSPYVLKHLYSHHQKYSQWLIISNVDILWLMFTVESLTLPHMGGHFVPVFYRK